jgi:hypothetical protein
MPFSRKGEEKLARGLKLVYTPVPSFFHGAHARLPSYHHHLYLSPNFCLRPSTLCLSATPSNSRNASKYRNNKASNTKGGLPLEVAGSHNRAHAPAELWRRSQARSEHASCGPILVHSLAKCPPLAPNQSMGSCSCMHVLVELASLLRARGRPEFCCGFDWPPASAACQGMVFSGQHRPNRRSWPETGFCMLNSLA